MASTKFRKTEAGRAEIRERRQALSRPARNLLVIIDDSRTGDEWLGLVAGAAPADLQALVDAGFVQAAAGVQAPPPAAAPAPPPVADAPAPASMDAASFRALYDYLTAQARPRLGLIKGYRAVLDIERSTDVAALRRYAEHFIEQVRAAQGTDAAAEVQRDLAALR